MDTSTEAAAAIRLTASEERERRARLERVLSGSRDGYFEWNQVTGVVERSAQVAAIVGLPPEAIAPTLEGWTALIHDDDRPALRESVAAVLTGGGQLDVEYRVRAADGTWRWINTRASHSLNDAGEAIVSGTVTDVSDRRNAHDMMSAALRRNIALVGELRQSLEQVTTLSGLLPICMYCKKIRDDAGYWEAVERYVASRTGARFSHGVCPDCYREHTSDLEEE